MQFTATKSEIRISKAVEKTDRGNVVHQTVVLIVFRKSVFCKIDNATSDINRDFAGEV